MPDAWAHHICGQLAAQRIRDVDRRSLMLSQKAALNLGCQAPDFFYYHNFRPWQTGRTLNMLSAAIHAERCDDFAVELVKNACQGSVEPESDLAFVAGFVSHWVLDRVTHPYIHYRAGVPGSKPQGVGLRSLNRHKHLELIIDVLMADKCLGVDARTTDFRLHAGLPRTLPEHICRLVEDAIRFVYPTISSVQPENFAQLGYRDMVASYNWSFDSRQLKQKYFWRWLDRAFGLQSWGVFHPHTLDPALDYLNEGACLWHHPAYPDESSTDSFHELFERAAEESSVLMEAILDYAEGKIGETHLRTMLGYASYSTGKDWRLGASILRHDDPFPIRRPY